MTFSIVARDAVTGQLGVAVQSRASPWERSCHGPGGRGRRCDPVLRRAGLWTRALNCCARASAEQALAQLVAADGAAVRQVAMVDARASSPCTPARAASLSPAMRVATASLPGQHDAQRHRLGGDGSRLSRSGRRSGGASHGGAARRESKAGTFAGAISALLVVAAVDSGRPWMYADVLVDLRVEDHPEPLAELERLLNLQRAFSHAEEADRRQEVSNMLGFWEELSAAERHAPDRSDWFSGRGSLSPSKGARVKRGRPLQRSTAEIRTGPSSCAGCPSSTRRSMMRSSSNASPLCRPHPAEGRAKQGEARRSLGGMQTSQPC